MKKTRLLAFLFNLQSMSAVAGYECVLKLAHTEDPYKTMAEKSFTIERGSIRAGSLGTLLVESDRRNKKSTLDINAVMSGWQGEEDATFMIVRHESNRHSHHAETISEKMTLKGDSSMTGWFDSYKLEIDCKVKE